MFKKQIYHRNRTSDFNRIQQLRRFGFSSVRKSGGWRDIRGKTSFLASDRCLFCHEGFRYTWSMQCFGDVLSNDATYSGSSNDAQTFTLLENYQYQADHTEILNKISVFLPMYQ